MLIAMAKKKVPAHFAEREDVITSTVLGPLRYWDVGRVWDVLYCLIHPSDSDFPSRPADAPSADVRFWPRERAGTGSCEPDLVVDLYDERTALVARVIVEVKWNFGASGERQLAIQKETFGVDGKPLFHVYLTRHHGWAASDILAAGPDTENVINLPWSILVSRIQKIGADPLLQRWATDVQLAMERMGVVSFSGFLDQIENSQKIVSFAFFSAFVGFDQCSERILTRLSFHFFSSAIQEVS